MQLLRVLWSNNSYGIGMNNRKAIWLKRLIFLILIVMLPLVYGEDTSNNKQVIVITISGPIGPATSDYVLHGLDEAINTGAELVILKMDTPGGLEISMREIIWLMALE